MIKMLLKNLSCCIAVAFACNGHSFAQAKGELLIRFNVTANGKTLTLNDSSYTNAFNETYQVSRLKYYISNIALSNTTRSTHQWQVFLLDAGNTDSITAMQPAGSFTSLNFMVGVDSALNCSGAQDGALDPLNGMFWTWNTGYIFFKLEGYSPASKADLQRIEHHIGGYRYPNAVARSINLALPKPLEIKEGSKHIITINMDLDKYWKGVNDIKIADQALLMTPGGLAIKAADNFQKMFSITAIE